MTSPSASRLRRPRPSGWWSSRWRNQRQTTSSPTLDPEQQAAATAVERFVRVRSGAGTGKTTTVVGRVAWLVEHAGVSPEKILVCTFSKKAAGELATRIDPAIAERALIGTIHALGLRILVREMPGIHVADEGVRRKLVRTVMQELKIDRKFAEVLGAIVRHKGRGEALEPWAVDVFGAYETKLRNAKLADFDDLLILPERLLRVADGIRARWRGRWRHILVDEVQDTSALQWQLFRHLVGDDTALFVVGDYSQAIYSWRGAEPSLMLEGVEELFGPFTDYPIATNYRSRPPIVALANRVIDGKPGALTLRPAREGGSSSVDWLPQAADKAGEAARVVKLLQAEHAAGRPWRECLILLRCNAQTEALEAVCLREGVPVVVAGGQGFYGRREIRDVLAYLRLAQGWDVEALERVFNRPSRYLGAAFLAELEREGGWAAVIAGKRPRFSKMYMGRRLDDLLTNVRELQEQHRDHLSPADLVEYVLENVGDEGYRAWLVGEEPSLEDEVRGENLDALVEAARAHATVADLLALAERCERRAEGQRKDGDGAVTLSTIHKQKGLEAPLVVVAGLTSGVLPHRLAHLHPDPERRKAQIEEERRIAYVAVTRARDRLILSSWGPRSPYWADMGGPEDEEDEEDDDAPTVTTPNGKRGETEDDGWNCEPEGRDAGEQSAARGACCGGARERLGADSDADADVARGCGGPAGRGARDCRPDGGL